MNIETQKQHFADLVKKSEDILFRKGNDYANTDRLSNFKLAGAIAGGSSETNCLNLIATKVARLGVLLNSDKAPDNESVRDSIIDLINYGILLDMILEEKAGEKQPAWHKRLTDTAATFVNEDDLKKQLIQKDDQFLSA